MKETRYLVTWDFGSVKAGLLRSCQRRKSWINIKSTLYPDARNFAMTWRQFWYFIVVFRFSPNSNMYVRRFSSSDACERVDELWSSDEGTSVNILYTQKFRTFITYLLVHMHQKTKIALDIAAEIAIANAPL